MKTKNTQTLRLYIETPSGERYEADIPCEATVGQVAGDFFEAQGWSTKDARGRGQRAVVELVDPGNLDNTRRLSSDKGICESGLRDGDTLRIVPEALAGSFSKLVAGSLSDTEKALKDERSLRLYIETPSGDRFEADISDLAKVDQIASDFFEAQGWPITGRRVQKAVVELVDPNNPDNTKRLNSTSRIGEAGVRNSDTLRITPLPQNSSPLFSGKTEMWLDDGVQIRYHIPRASKKLIRHIAWSHDGEVLASACTDGEIRLWDMRKKRSAGTKDTLRLFHSFHADDEDTITSIAWSFDGTMLASASTNETISLWDTATWQLLYILNGHQGIINSVAWAPDRNVLASASTDRTICLWDTDTRQLLSTLIGHLDAVNSVVWSPDGTMLASASTDRTICLWDTDTGQSIHTFIGHRSIINSIAWSPDGTILVSAAEDNTIRLWDSVAKKPQRILEGFTDVIASLSFSFDGRFLASKSLDGTLRLWRSDIWKGLEIMRETPLIDEDTVASGRFPGFAFHPQSFAIATSGEGNAAIYILQLNFDVLLNASFAPLFIDSSINYVNARVVVLGDSGVGKTGLSLVLTRQPFVETASTHGRHVWLLDKEEIALDKVHTETHETLLWDLAGQPGYRLIHQLHLNEATVALIVFDAHNEVDPFAGVYHWNRALCQAQRVNASPLPLKKFLVAARIDRGRIGVSSHRIESLVKELGFDGYFETSAQEGKEIRSLFMAIRKSIDWSAPLKITSTHLFQQIKKFLIAEKNGGRLLSLIGDLYHSFLQSKGAPDETDELQAQFEICIELLESQGLIRRLHLGNCVLLQPELLDVYASALVNAVKDEPDDMGAIAEDKVRKANFFIPPDVRLKDKKQENFLLISMIEDLLRQEIILREPVDEKVYLIFPSQSLRDGQNMPALFTKTVVFSFEGSVFHIYATLVVRLSQSGIFKKKEIWKNAVTYTTRNGGIYGILLENIGEGSGKLTVFCDNASEEMRFHFEDFVYEHLKRKIALENIRKEKIYTCQKCKNIMPYDLVQLRLKINPDWFTCLVCETRILLRNDEERLKDFITIVPQMNKDADQKRDSIAQAFVFQTLQNFPTIAFRKVDE